VGEVSNLSGASRLTLSGRDGDPLRFERSSSGSVLLINQIAATVPVVGQGSGGGSGDSNGSSGSFYDLPTPIITIESTRALNAQGQIINEITEYTPPFTLEVFFSDFGLINHRRDIESSRLETLAINMHSSGFSMPTTRGQLRQIDSVSVTGAPRFIARFSNVTYDGTGPARIEFRVHYDIFGELVPATTIAHFDELIPDEDEDDDDEIPIQTPHIIVSHFSYGGESIVAGSEFNLDITTRNTSSEVALENILIRITLPEGISIASASNTIYVERIAAGGTLSHSIPLWVRTNASAGSHAIQLEFSFEYVEGNRRQSGTGSESISVPVTQIDRFTVDPITDMSDFVNVGDMFFVSVSFVNQGMSPVYNISAQARGLNMDIISTVGRMEGVLAASAHGTIDLDIMADQPGELIGEVVITYEDENMHQREVTMPFSLSIQEPFFPEFPGPEFPGGEFPGWQEENQGLAPLNIFLIIIGGLMVAIPMAIYIARRIKAKESEEFDDDF